MDKLKHILKSTLYATTGLVLMLFFQSCEFIDEKSPDSNIDGPTARELELISNPILLFVGNYKAYNAEIPSVQIPCTVSNFSISENEISDWESQVIISEREFTCSGEKFEMDDIILSIDSDNLLYIDSTEVGGIEGEHFGIDYYQVMDDGTKCDSRFDIAVQEDGSISYFEKFNCKGIARTFNFSISAEVVQLEALN